VSPLTKIRLYLAVFIAGLVGSGITAFPLLYELNILCRLLGVADVHSASGYSGLTRWILHVREGLMVTYRQYPFVAYGTDWLAFGHIVIAIFFIGPLIDPVRNIWVIQAGLIACVAVLPLALICGPIREIPFYWRLIDCSFGVVGFIVLSAALRLVKNLRETAG
jgi:hypothetical protein